MKILEDIKKKKEAFSILCKNHDVNTIYAFGSAITDSFDDEKSDIDLLIDIDNEDPFQKGEYLISIWDKFEEFFQRKVDLLTGSSIKNPILKRNIDATKILIYDGKRGKVSF